jgi:hypothetical protein
MKIDCEILVSLFVRPLDGPKRTPFSHSSLFLSSLEKEIAVHHHSLEAPGSGLSYPQLPGQPNLPM